MYTSVVLSFFHAQIHFQLILLILRAEIINLVNSTRVWLARDKLLNFESYARLLCSLPFPLVLFRPSFIASKLTESLDAELFRRNNGGNICYGIF